VNCSVPRKKKAIQKERVRFQKRKKLNNPFKETKKKARDFRGNSGRRKKEKEKLREGKPGTEGQITAWRKIKKRRHEKKERKALQMSPTLGGKKKKWLRSRQGNRRWKKETPSYFGEKASDRPIKGTRFQLLQERKQGHPEHHEKTAPTEGFQPWRAELGKEVMANGLTKEEGVGEDLSEYNQEGPSVRDIQRRRRGSSGGRIYNRQFGCEGISFSRSVQESDPVNGKD